MPELPASADVVIVGGGIIGLTTALELSQEGLQVCIVEAGEIGRQCSWAGGGMLTPLPPDSPVPELQPLLQNSLDLYPEFCASLLQQTGIDPEYWVCGARFMKNGLALDYPEVAQVRNTRLIKALRLALIRRRVELIEGTKALGWHVHQGGLKGVETCRGRIKSSKAVLAAGSWSGQLDSLPISPAKGQMLLFKGPPGQLNQILIDDHIYLIPRRDGRILVGSTIEDVGFDTTPTALARTRLLKRATSLWPQIKTLTLENQWAGLRPRGLSSVPLIEQAGHIKGLFYNAGHFRLGITLAPASAKLLTALIIKPS